MLSFVSARQEPEKTERAAGSGEVDEFSQRPVVETSDRQRMKAQV